LVAAQVVALPDAAGTAVVVVAWDHQHGHRQGADGLQHLQHRFSGHGGRIEQVPRHQHGAGLPGAQRLADAHDGGDTFLLKAIAILGVFHGSVGFTDLPISGVDEAEQTRPVSTAPPF
jgi:hypothetical protein